MALFAANPRGLARFEDQALADYKQRLLIHVGRVMPTRARQLGEPRVRQIIDRSVAVGEQHGLCTEQELAQYTLLGVAAGDELVATAHGDWARPVLRRSDWSADHKVVRLQVLGRRHGLSFADAARP